jgi:glycosyltransferase involved in cell wall biosynthesis
MNLLLNASNLRHGGGKTVALQLINGLAPIRPNDRLYVIAPKTEEYSRLAKHENITLIPIGNNFHHSWLNKLYKTHISFPRLCDRLKIDKVVSLGNAAFPSNGRPHLVYIQLPQLVYHESQAWKRMDTKSFMRNSLMDQYVAFHLRYATSFAVQTDVMRARLVERFKLPAVRVNVLPNAPIEEEEHHPKPMPMPLQPLKLLFLSRYYPHKNFECLPELAAIIKERNIPVEISLTISAKEAKGAEAILNAVKEFPFIKNLGPIAIPDIGKVVDEHHGIFLPSLMESFSGAYAEALMHRRLIFTSHYDFATDLLRDAGFYFDPLRAESIARVLEEVATKPKVATQMFRPIELAAQLAPRITSVARTFSTIIDKLV